MYLYVCVCVYTAYIIASNLTLGFYRLAYMCSETISKVK